LLLEKPSETGSARLGHIPSLPLESQLPLKPYISLQPLDFKGNCDSSDCFLDFCFVSRCSFDLLRKCGLLAHTSELLHRKTFCSPAARCLQSCDFDAMFHVKHSQDAHSTSFEKTVETSMVLVSTPCFIEKIHKPFDRLNFNKRWLKTNE